MQKYFAHEGCFMHRTGMRRQPVPPKASEFFFSVRPTGLRVFLFLSVGQLGHR